MRVKLHVNSCRDSDGRRHLHFEVVNLIKKQLYCKNHQLDRSIVALARQRERDGGGGGGYTEHYFELAVETLDGMILILH